MENNNNKIIIYNIKQYLNQIPHGQVFVIISGSMLIQRSGSDGLLFCSCNSIN